MDIPKQLVKWISEEIRMNKFLASDESSPDTMDYGHEIDKISSDLWGRDHDVNEYIETPASEITGDWLPG